MNIPVQDSAFEQMVSTARILIIDYDINRFHSYELYSYLLTDREYFMQPADSNFLIDFVNCKNINQRVMYYLTRAPYRNVFYNFKEYTDHTMTITEYENRLNSYFDKIKSIPTEVSYRFSTIFYNKTVEGYLLKYKNDPYKCGYEDQVKVFKSDHILDNAMALAIIKKYNINAIFVSDINQAIQLAIESFKVGCKYPISFYIGIYRYNYDPKTGTLYHTPAIMGLEYNRKDAFVTFDPFTSLSYDKNSQFEVEYK